MKKTSLIKGVSLVTLLATLAGCGDKVTTRDYEKWARDHGWIEHVDVATSATEQGKGLTYGTIELSDKAKQAMLLEYIKGAAGNYREMWQIATSVNNTASISSVEYVMDPDNFNLYGMSEVGTKKTLEFAINPNVELYWTRQLRASDAMTYFQSYGVQYTGTVTLFHKEDLDDSTKKTEILKIARTYYTSAGYASIAAKEDADKYVEKAVETGQSVADLYVKNGNDYVKATGNAVAGTTYYELVVGLVNYLKGVMGTTQELYKIVPTKVVMTSPYLLYTYSNLTTKENYVVKNVQTGESVEGLYERNVSPMGMTYTATTDSVALQDKTYYEKKIEYPYPFLSETFLDLLLAEKGKVLADQTSAAYKLLKDYSEGKPSDQYHLSGYEAMLGGVVLLGTNATGIKTQQTLTNFTKVTQ